MGLSRASRRRTIGTVNTDIQYFVPVIILLYELSQRGFMAVVEDYGVRCFIKARLNRSFDISSVGGPGNASIRKGVCLKRQRAGCKVRTAASISNAAISLL